MPNMVFKSYFGSRKAVFTDTPTPQFFCSTNAWVCVCVPHFLFQQCLLSHHGSSAWLVEFRALDELVRDLSRTFGGCNGGWSLRDTDHGGCMHEYRLYRETGCACMFISTSWLFLGRGSNCFPYKTCNTLVAPLALLSVWVHLSTGHFLQLFFIQLIKEKYVWISNILLLGASYVLQYIHK